MKKAISLFLVFIIVFSLVGCNAAPNEETVTTLVVENTDNFEVIEVVQWTMANVMNKNSAARLVKASLYDEVKTEIEKYVNALPYSVEINIEKPSFSDDFFEISIIF